jgi:hypothetical protein
MHNIFPDSQDRNSPRRRRLTGLIAFTTALCRESFVRRENERAGFRRQVYRRGQRGVRDNTIDLAEGYSFRTKTWNK